MCSQSLCRAAVFLHLRYTGDIGPAVCALMKKTAESTLKCLFWSKLKISSVPKPCNTPTEQDCNSNTSSKTTLRFGPLILVYLVLCKSHMVLQISKIGPFLLPFSWSLPLEFSDRALSFSFEKLLILSQNRERTEEKEKNSLSSHSPPNLFWFAGGENSSLSHWHTEEKACDLTVFSPMLDFTLSLYLSPSQPFTSLAWTL